MGNHLLDEGPCFCLLFYLWRCIQELSGLELCGLNSLPIGIFIMGKGLVVMNNQQRLAGRAQDALLNAVATFLISRT